jgi:ribosomal protein S18 acetylase RimI-like enzyme
MASLPDDATGTGGSFPPITQELVMTDSGIGIHTLEESDWDAWWALRLVALRGHPDAFGSDYDETVAAGEASSRDRFVSTAITGDNRIVGAFTQDDVLIGSCGIIRHSGAKSRHRMDLWGMYVEPGFRRDGIGNRLAEAIIAHARQTDGVIQIHLTVASHNIAAVTTYYRIGFTMYGREPRSLKLPDRFVDEDLMVLTLDTERAK